MTREDFDVAIAGGGPGGSVLAARLAQKGRRVVVLEREHFPRFHLGESLLPQSMAALETVGLLGEVTRRFLVKRGATFHDWQTDKTARFDFGDAFGARFNHAFQVPRDEFDELLLRHAQKLGADVREGWTVTRVRFEGTVATGFDTKAPDGTVHAIHAAVVVDATGRDALLARAQKASERIAGLDKTALFSHWTGAWRDAGEREGDIQIVVFQPKRADANGTSSVCWFWFIPFKDGRTSVGAVLSSEWMKRHHAGETVESLYRQAIAESKVATHMLANATALWPARAAADFTFRVRDLSGDGWLAVGDSGGFIDPLFSSGAHIAMDSALHAADAINQALATGNASRAVFADWERHVKVGASLFLQMVQAFYEGALTPLLFNDKPHPFLRKAITSLLSGHVYDEDARWLKEVRARFALGASETVG